MSHVSRVWVAVVLLVFGMRILSADDPNKGTSSSERIDLGHWKLTLPVDAAGAYNGHASEVAAGQLSSDFRSSHFRIDDNGSIEFWCPVTGARTEGTEFPRTELREMLDPQNSSVNWTVQGTHILSAQCRVNQVPSTPKVVIGQIHSYSGNARPLVKLQYYKGRVEALVKSSPTKGKDIKLVWPEVGLGNDFSYKIKLQDGVLSITVNDNEQTVNVIQNNQEWADQTFYFKAGVYPQDNEGPASEGARVIFSQLVVSHSTRTVDQ